MKKRSCGLYMPNDRGALVDANWLNEQLTTNKQLVILHTAMTNPVTGEAPILGQQVIPTAKHFDFETVFCDMTRDLPHTMPSAADFEQQAQRLGINRDSVIVVYDDVGLYCAPRAWWMFRAMGHLQVYVLNGGLPAWLDHRFDCDGTFSGVNKQGDFRVKPDKQSIINLNQLLEVLKTQKTQVVDARSAARFEGKEPEPRAGLRGGHIPTAKNIPFPDVLSGAYLKPLDTLRQIFNARKINCDDAVVFSCGSGVTACVLALAAYEIGYQNLSVYDGSWSEWGREQRLPLETGKAIE